MASGVERELRGEWWGGGGYWLRLDATGVE
jgi:hypothetical protein